MQADPANDGIIVGNQGGPDIFDVTTVDFEDKVMKASVTQPILVDFWAPWCGPCKQMMPALEQAIRETGGKVSLAKINIDENPELAQAMRVQSVPAVFSFFGGQPVNAFMGAKPQSEIKAFIDELLQLAKQAQPDALDVPEALKEAAQALVDNEIAKAQAIYVHILQEDEHNTEAYIGMVRSFIAAGEVESAKHMIEDVPEVVAKDSAFESARSALALAENIPSGDVVSLQKSVVSEPDNHQMRFDLAMALFASGQKCEAIDALIEIIRRDQEWEDGKARKQLLQFFDALGFNDPEAVSGRKKLSFVLFS